MELETALWLIMKKTSSYKDLVDELMKDPEFVAAYRHQRTICAMSPEAHKEERLVKVMYRGILGVCMPCYLDLTEGAERK